MPLSWKVPKGWICGTKRLVEKNLSHVGYLACGVISHSRWKVPSSREAISEGNLPSEWKKGHKLPSGGKLPSGWIVPKGWRISSGGKRKLGKLVSIEHIT